MTILFSAVSLIARVASALLTTALGWASSLLFGRVQRSHAIYVVLMLAGSALWVFLIIAAIVPQIPGFIVDSTPHPAFDRSWVYPAIIGGIVLLPFGVGVVGYLVPTEGERPEGLAALGEALRGYLLTPLLVVLLVFLAAVALTRKGRNARRRWSDTHISIVVKPDGYDRLVDAVQEVLANAGLPVEAKPAPAALSAPAWLLSKVAGPSVGKLRAERLVQLRNICLRIEMYPSDMAISGPTHERTKARVAILSGLTTTAAYMTATAEAQEIEARVIELASRAANDGKPTRATVAAEFGEIDKAMSELELAPEEWEVLYRLRLRVERDLLAGPRPRRTTPAVRSAEQPEAAETPAETQASETRARVSIRKPQTVGR